jgi:hypothetical protein
MGDELAFGNKVLLMLLGIDLVVGTGGIARIAVLWLCGALAWFAMARSAHSRIRPEQRRRTVESSSLGDKSDGQPM